MIIYNYYLLYITLIWITLSPIWFSLRMQVIYTSFTWENKISEKNKYIYFKRKKNIYIYIWNSYDDHLLDLRRRRRRNGRRMIDHFVFSFAWGKNEWERKCLVSEWAVLFFFFFFGEYSSVVGRKQPRWEAFDSSRKHRLRWPNGLDGNSTNFFHLCTTLPPPPSSSAAPSIS